MNLWEVLEAGGNLLDLPGSVARDIMAWENPVDQFLSPFSSENRNSGRDVLEKWGALGENTEGLDWGDAAGFGLELVSDPTNLIPAGLIGKTLRGGKLAKAHNAAELAKAAIPVEKNIFLKSLDDVAQTMASSKPTPSGPRPTEALEDIYLGVSRGQISPLEAVDRIRAAGRGDLFDADHVPDRQPGRFSRDVVTADDIDSYLMDKGGEFRDQRLDRLRTFYNPDTPIPPMSIVAGTAAGEMSPSEGANLFRGMYQHYDPYGNDYLLDEVFSRVAAGEYTMDDAATALRRIGPNPRDFDEAAGGITPRTGPEPYFDDFGDIHENFLLFDKSGAPKAHMKYVTSGSDDGKEGYVDFLGGIVPKGSSKSLPLDMFYNEPFSRRALAVMLGDKINELSGAVLDRESSAAGILGKEGLYDLLDELKKRNPKLENLAFTRAGGGRYHNTKNFAIPVERFLARRADRAYKPRMKDIPKIKLILPGTLGASVSSRAASHTAKKKRKDDE